MTHKKPHWTKELKEENERLKEARRKELLSAKQESKNDTDTDLLKRIYQMTGDYYCDISKIRFIIKEHLGDID